MIVLSSSAVPVFGWEPQPDVWLLVGLLAAMYWVAIVRLGPRLAPDPLRPVSRKQVAAYSLGVLTTWVAADWPVHIVAERSLYSVHMVQHLAFTIVAVPLLMMGTPAWLARWLLSPRWLLRTAQFSARFLPAIVIYNAVLVLTHWPTFVDATLRNGFVHFLGHAVIFVSAIAVWLPIMSPLPEIPRLQAPVQMLYLFTQSILPTVPASFLTFGSHPLYRFYEGTERVLGFSVLDDQAAAGLIMKVGAGLIIWGVIATVFLRWASEDEAESRVRTRRRVTPSMLPDLTLETEKQ